MIEFITLVILVGLIAVLWSSFYRVASPKILVEITESSIVLTTKNKKIDLKPYLYISKGNKRNRLLSVGEGTPPSEPSIKVDLMKYNGEVGGKEQYLECLSAYFRHAFYKVVGRKLFVIPNVSIIGAGKIVSSIHEISEKSIFKAIKQAGASQCKFK